MKRHITYIAMLLTALTGASCSQDETPAGDGRTGVMAMTISTSRAEDNGEYDPLQYQKVYIYNSEGGLLRKYAAKDDIPERLELLSGGAGVSIIDDAFNANPVGAQCALRVIRDFPGRRIIITPGMVELGGNEDGFNRAFGEQMADSVDIAILVGKKHTQPIVDGLTKAGFPQENIHVVGSLEESTTLLHGMMRSGDVVLYENDLPDNYSE